MTAIERSGSLTRSQQRMWLRMSWREIDRTYPALRHTWTLPEPLPVDVVVRVWETLVARQEILRTVFTLGPDNQPVQLVLASDGFQLPLTFGEESSLAEHTAERPRPLLDGTGVLTVLWQARLFLRDGKVASVCLTYEHLISDGTGLDNWREQFLGLCAGRDVPLPTTQPLDRQAEEERLQRPLAAGARSGTADLYATAPGLLIPATRTDVPLSRYLLLTKRYAGMLSQVDAICKANRVSRTTVLMYALGWLLARHSGRRSILFSSLFANRLAADHSIDCQMMPVDMLLEFRPESSIGSELRSAHAVALTAYARYRSASPSALLEDPVRGAADRGLGLIEPIMYNYIPDVAPTLADLREREYWDTQGRPYCNILYVYQSGADFTLGFDVDTAMFSKSFVERMSELLPKVVDFLAGDGDTPMDTALALTPGDFERSPDCHLVGQDWVRLATVRRLLLEAPHVRQAEVSADGRELTARLTLSPDGDVFDVHESVTARLHEHVDAMAPTRYVLSGTTQQWRPRTDLPQLGAETYAERELREAIRETHGHAVTNMAHTFLAAGGDLLRTPALVQALRRKGLTGLRHDHFLAPFTLRAIARCLVRNEHR